jgi:acetylglutamate kinase
MSGRPRPLVVKLGGTTLAEEAGVLADVGGVARRRDVVVVHGGGKRLTDWLARLGVAHRFDQGLRVTDDAALEVAVAVLGGLVNTELVAALRSLGVDAVGLSGLDGGLLVGERVPRLGRVVSVVGVRGAILEALWLGGLVPVVAPLASDARGVTCNTNADDTAAGLAAGIGADLILLTDTDGVRDADGRAIASLTPRDAMRLVDAGVIEGGMVPKVRAATRALVRPDSVVVIADGRTPGALLSALDGGRTGTRIQSG